MKEKIHPKFYTDCKVTCGCGNTFITGSTKPELRVDVCSKENIKVEICSKCHPFYTGQQRSVAARGRIEKFNKRYNVESK